MHTTHELIDLAKQRLALAHSLRAPLTDYRLAKLLGVSTQVVSGWQRGKRTIGSEFAQKFADACELPTEYVYACIEHERAKDPTVSKILANIAEVFKNKVGKAAAAILTVGLFLALPNFTGSNNAYAFDRSIHYAQRRRRRILDMVRGMRCKPLARCTHNNKLKDISAMRPAALVIGLAMLTGCAAVNDTITTLKQPKPVTTEQTEAARKRDEQRAQLNMEREKQRQFERCMNLTLGKFASFQSPDARIKAAEACKKENPTP